MKKVKKMLSFALVLALVITTIAGCAGSKDKETPTGNEVTNNTSQNSSSTVSTEDSSKPVKLKVLVLDLLNDEATKAAFKAKYPNIDYEVVAADNVKLMSMVAAENAPDVWGLSAFHMGCMYAARGLYLNLDPYIEKSTIIKRDDFTDIQKLFQFDGKNIGSGPVYGIVKDWSLDTMLWINKAVFESVGLTVPDPMSQVTWEQVADWAKKIVKFEGDQQVRWGLGTYNNIEQRLLFQLAQLGTSMYTPDLKKALVKTPEMKKVLGYWADVFKAKAAPSIVSMPGDEHGVSLFAEDKCGMLQLGYWFNGYLKTNDKAKERLDNFILCQSPVWEGGKPANACLAGVGGSIYAKSKNPDAAWKFIEFYYGDQPAKDRAKLGWGIPMLKSLVPLMPQETAFDKACYASNQKGMENVITLTTNQYTNAGAVQAVFDKYFNQVLFDKMSLDEAMDKMQADYDTMIQEGMEIIGVE